MTVSVIIPAYNEASRIENVLVPLDNDSLISNITVVDDGSKDHIASIVKKYEKVNLIQLPKNMGKAAAIKAGLKQCEADIILLFDADLIGLKHQHIEDMLNPLFYNDVEMTIGIFQSGRLITDLAQKIAPNLSGQRAFKNTLLKDILELNMNGYSIEVAISKYIKNNNIKYQQVYLRDISHVMKEEKIGFSKGMVWRLKMYKDIIKYWLN